MPAVRRDLTVEQGTTWEHSFGVRVRNLPIDSTWTVKAQARVRYDSAEIVAEWSTGLGNASVTGPVTIDGSPYGVVSLTIAPATSTAWGWVSGVYDVEVTSTTGEVLRVAEGNITLRPEVTR